MVDTLHTTVNDRVIRGGGDFTSNKKLIDDVPATPFVQVLDSSVTNVPFGYR